MQLYAFPVALAGCQVEPVKILQLAKISFLQNKHKVNPLMLLYGVLSIASRKQTALFYIFFIIFL
jgi:hypothetical protein